MQTYRRVTARQNLYVYLHPKLHETVMCVGNPNENVLYALYAAPVSSIAHVRYFPQRKHLKSVARLAQLVRASY